MNYSYIHNNQLERPCSYMYSEFGGPAFLVAYRQSRLSMVASLSSVRVQAANEQDLQLLARWREKLVQLAAYSPAALPQAKVGDLTRFDLERPIRTAELLDAMLQCSPDHERWSFWLARLVQRFEVTKKMYKIYLPGFRKGEGEYDDLSNYRKLALLLAQGFVQSGSLAYLNALLKVNDLMFSALEQASWSRPALELLALLAAAELQFVERLGDERGVSSAG